MMFNESMWFWIQSWAANVLFWVTIVLLLALCIDLVLASCKKTLWRSTFWNLCWVFLLLLPLAGWVTPKVFVFVDNTDRANAILNYEVQKLDRRQMQHNPVASSPNVSEPKSSRLVLSSDYVVDVPSAEGTSAASRTSISSISVPTALAAVYLCGLAWAMFSLFSRLVAIQKLYRLVSPVNDRTWNTSFSFAMARLNLGSAVKLTTTDETVMPMVVGIWKPTVLVPSSLIKTLTERESFAVVMHELTHIKRCDQRWNLLYQLSRAIFWFHPLLWVAGTRFSQSRESSCDDFCIHALGSAREYGETLLKVASSQLIPAARLGVSFVGHSKIGARIKLISVSEGNMLCYSKRLTGLAMLICMSMFVTVSTSFSIYGSSPDIRIGGVDEPQESASQPAVQEPVVGEPGKIYSGSIQLLSRKKFGDYEKATFSFEHGVRDDHESRLVNNDWDLLYGNGRDEFTVNTVVDDRSSIFDLGKIDFAELDEMPTQIWKQSESDHVNGIAGHMYVVHTRDDNSDHISLFHVEKMIRRESCTLRWVHLRSQDDGGMRRDNQQEKQQQLLFSKATETKLVKLLLSAKNARRAMDRKRLGVVSGDADIILQMRTGAQGGNSAVVDFAGNSKGFPAKRMRTVLDFTQPPNIDDEESYFVRGGVVPDGKVFLVQSIDIYAHALGDENGHGEAIFRIGETALVRRENEDHRINQAPLRMWFDGLFVLRPHHEGMIHIELTNSSAIDVRIKGKLVDSTIAQNTKEVPFTPGEAPKGAKRAGDAY